MTPAELLFGISALPLSKHKNMLAKTRDGLMRLFRYRRLLWDADAARHYAALHVIGKIQGWLVSFENVAGRHGQQGSPIQDRR